MRGGSPAAGTDHVWAATAHISPLCKGAGPADDQQHRRAGRPLFARSPPRSVTTLRDCWRACGSGRHKCYLGRRPSAVDRRPRWALAPLLGWDAERFRVGSAVMLGQHLADVRPRVPAEDGVLHQVPRDRDVEALAISAEPIGGQVRAPVAADPGDDDVTRLSEERLDLVG
jgi:hypothetical protein